MDAIQLLRQMHADTKVQFKLILGSDDPSRAAEQWQALQLILDLHEQLEDEFLYTPLSSEMGPDTSLGDWDVQHDADVATVKQLVEAANQLEPATPQWRMGVASVMDLLNKHVTDEEGQIFGRIEQAWGPERLEEAGKRMVALKNTAASSDHAPASTTSTKRIARRAAAAAGGR